MYVVIFRARVRALDETYGPTAQRMREVALGEFGCREFHSVSEGEHEVSLSYWDDLAQIRAFKGHLEHVAAQQQGKERWYASYRVEVCQVVRSYGGGEP